MEVMRAMEKKQQMQVSLAGNLFFSNFCPLQLRLNYIRIRNIWPRMRVIYSWQVLRALPITIFTSCTQEEAKRIPNDANVHSSQGEESPISGIQGPFSLLFFVFPSFLSLSLSLSLSLFVVSYAKFSPPISSESASASTSASAWGSVSICINSTSVITYAIHLLF